MGTPGTVGVLCFCSHLQMRNVTDASKRLAAKAVRGDATQVLKLFEFRRGKPLA